MVRHYVHSIFFYHIFVHCERLKWYCFYQLLFPSVFIFVSCTLFSIFHQTSLVFLLWLEIDSLSLIFRLKNLYQVSRVRFSQNDRWGFWSEFYLLPAFVVQIKIAFVLLDKSCEKCVLETQNPMTGKCNLEYAASKS